ncbi:hypothetical protein CBM2585_B120203 [Cupriavidus taiwanensis]|nr:hypothetical protein CBM2585_B120203 [Cupriavidus taiwanensis]SPC14620.1 hypothetical protein CT19431_MP100202 [Cupriavidus taiwanensis]
MVIPALRQPCRLASFTRRRAVRQRVRKIVATYRAQRTDEDRIRDLPRLLCSEGVSPLTSRPGRASAPPSGVQGHPGSMRLRPAL